MDKVEFKKVIKKIKAYYTIFSLDEDSMNEWYNRLKNYDYEDVINKFEEHLNSEYALEPPKLHFITKYLKTTEQKEKAETDFLIRCDLCGKEMYLSEYENQHRKKCLHIKTLIPILQEKGENVSYEILDEYDYETINKLVNKYLEIIKDVNKLVEKI